MGARLPCPCSVLRLRDPYPAKHAAEGLQLTKPGASWNSPREAHRSARIELAQSDPQATGALEGDNRDAIAFGCFGVAWIVANDETYFGQDRLYLLDRRLTQTAS